MRKLFTAIFLILLCNFAEAQKVNLLTNIGQGININSEYDVNLYQATFNFQPQYEIDKFKFSAVTLSVLNDSVTSIFGGSQISYKATDKIDIAGRFLFGTEGKQLYGGGLQYNFLETGANVAVNVGAETKEKELYIDVTIGYNLLK